MMNEEEHDEKFLDELKEMIGKTDRPLTVVVIGTPGAGKSSFINTMITSITGKYRQWTRPGDNGGFGTPVTPRVVRILREEYISTADKSLQEYNFPNFMDISGIQNLNNEITTKLLELIFYGRIPSNVSLEEVAENISSSKLGVWLTEKKYPKTPECKKIDRIIFIASAAKPGLPLELMQAVLKVLRRKGDIPVFGVLTKKDLCQEEEEELKQIEMNFKTTLGLSKLNYLNCTNYCDENIDEIQQRIKTHYPELDKPVHKFLIQVLDPVVQSIDFHTSPGSSKERVIELVYKMVATLKGIDNMHMLFMIAVILLIAIILALVFMRP